MNLLTLKDPKILGEEHPTYGFSVWSETDGDFPVMFNSKQGNIMPGTRISYEDAEQKTSARGNDYLRLKKVKFEDNATKSIPFENKPEPTFKENKEAMPKSDAYLKDISNTPVMMYNGSLNYASQAGLNIIGDDNDRRVYLEYIKDITDEVLGMIDKIRNPQPSLKKEWDERNKG